MDGETHFGQDVMKGFYVQVMSTSSTTQFPDNKPSLVKNRLPYLLQFKEMGWKVGFGKHLTNPFSAQTSNHQLAGGRSHLSIELDSE